MIRQLQVKHQGCLQIWYLDDGVFSGKLSDLDILFHELEMSLLAIDLLLNLSKSRLYTLGDPSQLPNLQRLPLVCDGLKILGTPIGSDAFLSDS